MAEKQVTPGQEAVMGSKPNKVLDAMMHRRKELRCWFFLPERHDLIIFLAAFSSRWDISFCHYHRQGETTGATLLIGIQVAGTKKDEFWDHVKKLGYEYTV
ncbi:hypothetical protein RHGRI_028435 [Rhododendron griersonianum]|nr:hypothetical protein RHGRI_028435 [Rhododendron griersonianum]